MARNRQRDSYSEFLLFHATDVLGLRVARRISFEAGEAGVSSGSMVHCYLGERCIGYQMCATRRNETDVGELSQSGMLTKAEMDLYVGTAFKHGKSRTAGMSEEQRLSRIHPKSGKQLPSEDAIERVLEKVKAFRHGRCVPA